MATRGKKVVEDVQFDGDAVVRLRAGATYRRCVFGPNSIAPTIALAGPAGRRAPQRKVTTLSGLVFEHCTFVAPSLHDVSLEDSVFRACKFAQQSRMARGVANGSQFARVAFEQCSFMGVLFGAQLRGVKFLGCTFDATSEIHHGDFGYRGAAHAGVMWDDSRLPEQIARVWLPINYTHTARGVATPARGVVAAGEIVPYRIGNEFLKRLMTTAQWSSEDGNAIDGLVFDRLDLSGLDLSRVEFRACGFIRCDLSDVQSLSATACRFGDCEMRGLRNPSAIESHFENCNLQNLNQAAPIGRSGASLRDARFLRCNFRDARLDGGTLDRVEFAACTMIGADIRGASLEGARGTFDGADLTDAGIDPKAKTFLATITGPMANGAPWDHRLPRPTWTLRGKYVRLHRVGMKKIVRAWSRT